MVLVFKSDGILPPQKKSSLCVSDQHPRGALFGRGPYLPLTCALLPLPPSSLFSTLQSFLHNMLAFQSTTLPAQWMDSPLLPAASAFDPAFHFDHPSLSPFLDAGRPVFEPPSIDSIYYPVLPLDGEGVYRSPKAAFRKQVAANKADPRWKHAGIGLGLGLTGTTTHAGVLQWSYVQSRPPHFLGRPETESQKPAVPPAPVVPDTFEAPASSLWAALTEFFDTLSGIESPTPDTAAGENAQNSLQDSIIIPTISTPPAADTMRTVSLIVSAIDDSTISPVSVPALPQSSVSVSPLPLPASPCAQHRFAHHLSPIGLVVSSVPVLALPPSSVSASPPLQRAALFAPHLSPRQVSPVPEAVQEIQPNLRVSFAPSNPKYSPSERPAWFAHEEARATELARRFHIGRGVTSLDRRRARCAAVEEQLAVTALRRAEEETRAEERARVVVSAVAGRKPRFTLCGLSYDMVIRQQRRRMEGEQAREAQRTRWLAREEELAEAERALEASLEI
ncbi:hypothetical protein C8R47DRAFT_1326649 [Mycena vitilis]|nr:hypothetical protein C8R47DRAFT_1326649 [Mycena vitilis]